MSRTHRYEVTVEWTGNRGQGTADYRAYGRDHDIRADGKATTISASADPGFRGDADRWNPEELLVASLAQCHMLWYLHRASVADVVVLGYLDAPIGTLELDRDGSGRFTGVTLRPVVTVADADMVERARALHDEAAAMCFIARSVDFTVHHEPEIRVSAA